MYTISLWYGNRKSIKIKNSRIYGKDYEDSPSPPTLTLSQLIVTGVQGNYTVGETVSGIGSDGSTTVTA